MEKTLEQRRLERIVLINSSTFRYSEVYVDGNTHIAGDNSVGKSSFLQIAMLFYTGDPSRTKLGIGDGKLPFQQYHLKHTYSYIVYEVKRSDKPGDYFMVVLRSSSWPTFTFFDCPYSKDIFFDENNAAYDNIESVKNAAKRIHGDIDIHASKGTREYLDVLYGWKNGTLGRKLGLEKFSLCTCPPSITGRPHDRIANLLQMLLNLGKVQGDVLKKMIVSSLESESHPFNVNTHREGAMELLKQYNAIRNWSDPVLIQAQNRFIKAYTEHDAEKKAYRLYPAQAKYARQIAEEDKVQYVAEREKEIEGQKTFEATVKSRRADIDNQLDEMNGRVRVLKQNLTESEKKKNSFKSLLPLIPLIESEVEKKKDKSFTEGLIASLTEESKTLKEGFDKQKEQLDLDFSLFEAQMKTEVAGLETQIAKEAKAHSDAIDAEWNQHNEIHQKTISALDIQFKNVNEKVNHLKEELYKIQASHPKAQEIGDAKKQRSVLIREIEAANKEIEVLKNDILFAEQAKKGIPDRIKLEHAQTRHQLDDDVRRLTEQEEEQNNKIRIYKGSLAEWLDDNQDNWTGSIGKVVSEKVLLRSDLSPSVNNDSGKSIFGISVDLSKLPQAQTTPAALKEELQNIQDKLVLAVKARDEENAVIEKEINEKIAEKDAIITEKEKEIESLQKALDTKTAERDTIDSLIDSLVKEESRLVAEQSASKNSEIAAAEKEQEAVEEQKKQENTEFESYTTSIVNRKKDKEKELADKLKMDRSVLSDKLENQRKSVERKKDELDAALTQLLSEKGVEPEKIAELSKKLSAIEKELKTIDDNRVRYYQYQSAKQDYFDHEEEWNSAIADLTIRIEKTKKNEEILRGEEDRQAKEIASAIEDLDKTIDECDEDINAVVTYYGEHRSEEYVVAEPIETDYRAQIIVKNDADALGKIQALEDAMETSWLKFGKVLGDYGLKLFFPSSANCIDIKNDEFAQQDVYDFINENHIEAHVLGWNTHAIPFVSDIFYSASDFKKDIDSIREIVRDINRTFKANNFTEVIKRFELSVEEVGTELISLIHGSEAIHRDYCDDAEENRNLLDGSNKNKRFIGYIQSLATKLGTYSYDTIQIEDMFTLYIEADEGMNKSGRKKEIRELGSNGIDTIFKNILYLLMIQNIRKRFSHKGETFLIHCPVDEQASLSPGNFNHLMDLANRLGILILANSPTMPVGTEESFKRAYRFYRAPGTDNTRADCLLNRR